MYIRNPKMKNDELPSDLVKKSTNDVRGPPG